MIPHVKTEEAIAVTVLRNVFWINTEFIGYIPPSSTKLFIKEIS